ncbi:hypothetical protein DAI22_02g090300 [Oryza sativa Japonica Group]|nr:hypothetical protein DAI22_02g090300 [Oryza sativa Japonica Group]
MDQEQSLAVERDALLREDFIVFALIKQRPTLPLPKLSVAGPMWKCRRPHRRAVLLFAAPPSSSPRLHRRQHRRASNLRFATNTESLGPRLAGLLRQHRARRRNTHDRATTDPESHRAGSPHRTHRASITSLPSLKLHRTPPFSARAPPPTRSPSSSPHCSPLQCPLAPRSRIHPPRFICRTRPIPSAELHASLPLSSQHLYLSPSALIYLIHEGLSSNPVERGRNRTAATSSLLCHDLPPRCPLRPRCPRRQLHLFAIAPQLHNFFFFGSFWFCRVNCSKLMRFLIMAAVRWVVLAYIVVVSCDDSEHVLLRIAIERVAVVDSASVGVH